MDREIQENMARINQACRDLADRKITREECKRLLIEEYNVADFNLDMLLDEYDPGRMQ